MLLTDRQFCIKLKLLLWSVASEFRGFFQYDNLNIIKAYPCPGYTPSAIYITASCPKVTEERATSYGSSGEPFSDWGR
jgi:hypothetical protein